MDNLEEQLRKSRQKARPELRAPAGGWEAVQASLAATAAATATGAAAAQSLGTSAGKAGVVGGVAATTAKASLLAAAIKAIIGVVVLGGVATGGWMLVEGQETEADRTNPSAAQVLSVAPTEGQPASGELAASAGLNGGQLQVPVAGNKDMAIEDQANRQAAVRQSSAGATSVRTGASSSLTRTTNNEEPGTINPSLSEQRDGGRTENGLGDPSTPYSSSVIDPTVESLPASKDDPPLTVPGATTEPSANEALLTPSDTLKGLPFAGTNPAEADVDPLPAGVGVDGESTLENIKADEINIPQSVAVQPLPSSSVDEVSFEWSTLPYLTDEEIVGSEQTFGKHRRPSWSAWQLHGGVGGLIGKRNFNFGGGTIYERTESQFSSRVITLASGEEVGLQSVGGTSEVDIFNNNLHYRFGVIRQTNWGGAYSLSLNHYRYNERDVVDRNTLDTDQFTLDRHYKERSSFVDIGFQYTILRRHRFRPFVGLGLILGYSLKTERFDEFFVAETGETGEDPLTSSNLSFSTPSNLAEVTVTAGFQYQLTSRWSVGAHAWGNIGWDNLFVEAPLALEARYILK